MTSLNTSRNNSVRYIDIVLDLNPDIMQHVNELTQSCYLPLRYNSQIRLYDKKEMTTTFVHSPTIK